jgi:hypothetical protein
MPIASLLSFQRCLCLKSIRILILPLQGRLTGGKQSPSLSIEERKDTPVNVSAMFHRPAEEDTLSVRASHVISSIRKLPDLHEAL